MWLWNEEKELRERYVKFSVGDLKRITAESIGVKSCVPMIKLAKGGYNKVFKLVMDNGAVAIARIPCLNAGPAFKTTALEVATMEFARTVLNIPIPKIHAWSAVADNPIQAEYIVMEGPPGTPLAEIWVDVELQSKDKVIGDLVTIEKKLLSMSFTWAEVSSDISIELKKEVEERFTIGPVVEPSIDTYRSRPLLIFVGETAHDYLEALANNQINWLGQHAV
ncbi:hypothetical protein B7463_g9044, partial [Scytalidium lignicola]